MSRQFKFIFMKKISFFSIILLLSIVFLDSCTIVKRRYSSGYTITWNSNLKSNKVNKSVDLSNNEDIIAENSTTEEVVPSLTINEDLEQKDLSYNINNSSFEKELISEKDNNSQYNETKNINSSSDSEIVNSIDKKEGLSHLKKVKNERKSSLDDTDKLIGFIFCILGLAPFGIRYVKGKKSKAYKKNLIIWIIGYSCIILGFTIVLASGFSISILGFIIYFIGGIMLLISFIHALKTIFR